MQKAFAFLAILTRAPGAKGQRCGGTAGRGRAAAGHGVGMADPLGAE